MPQKRMREGQEERVVQQAKTSQQVEAVSTSEQKQPAISLAVATSLLKGKVSGAQRQALVQNVAQNYGNKQVQRMVSSLKNPAIATASSHSLQRACACSQGKANQEEGGKCTTCQQKDVQRQILSSPNRFGEGASLQRAVRTNNVGCHSKGITNPNLSGPEAVAAIEAADAEAITLAQGAEAALTSNLASVRGGGAVDPDFNTILREELGLTLINRRQFGLVQQQITRFRRVRTTLESGYLRYVCKGNRVGLIGCSQGSCADNFAFTCPSNRLMVLCQSFWDTPDQRGATILHEPFHIWFHMARHNASALRRADASCFESFALRVAGQAAFASCAAHTGG